jgi:hypothetical protein
MICSAALAKQLTGLANLVGPVAMADHATCGASWAVPVASPTALPYTVGNHSAHVRAIWLMLNQR